MGYRGCAVLLVVGLLCFGCGATAPAGAPPEAHPEPAEEATVLARGGQALLPVVTAADASDKVRKAAEELASCLGKITGGTFEVTTGDGASGIAVGTAADFPALPFKDAMVVEDIPGREHYVLKSHPGGVYVIGATDLAAQHGVWDLLYRLGYRQFFPGKTWEVIPRSADLSVAVDADERPDYYVRRIWYGWGLWDYNREPYGEWCRRNRTVSAFALRTGHSYDGIIRSNKAEFDRRPEYYGLIDGERKSTKICIGNPAVRKLVADYALRTFEADPQLDSISMDPSDGGGWCECEQCAALGSVSDRALILANHVAMVVDEKFEGKRVGMYAYAYHSPPPSIPVHPNVVISVATAFVKGGYRLDDLITGWAAKGATLGIREYYDVNTWSRDMPGSGRGTNLSYLRRTIPDFHGKGARFMSAESSDNWGPCGPGYYVASRMLWDIREAERVDELVDDFLARAFGPAEEPMREFYRLIDGSNRPLMCDHMLGKMYQSLGRARRLADAPEIRARISDLVLYTRYVELFRHYQTNKGARRQFAFEEVIKHAYRMRTTMMIHTKGFYRDLDNRDKSVFIPEGRAWNVPEEKNSWKSSEPFTEAEIGKFIGDGVAAHKTVDIQPASYSTRLVPAAALGLAKVETGTFGGRGRGVQTFYTWVDAAPKTFELKITGGLIAHYRDRGNVKVDLWKVGGEQDVRVAHGESAPDGVERVVSLQARETGLHKITVSDGHDMTRVLWEPGTRMTALSSLEARASFHGRWSLYFYVPRGTKAVGLYASGRGTLLDAEGKTVYDFGGKKAGYHTVPVPEGQGGKLWKFHQTAGRRFLITVPPCLARDADELLLPEEVVRADAPPAEAP